MMRAAWMMRVAGVALTALAITAASAPAQQVRQQSVRPAYDVDSAMARATLLRRQNRKAEAERVMAQAVAMAPSRADARALHEQLGRRVERLGMGREQELPDTAAELGQVDPLAR